MEYGLTEECWLGLPRWEEVLTGAEERNGDFDTNLCKIDGNFLVIASLVCLLSMSCNLLSFFKELIGKEEDYLKHHCNIKPKKINRKQVCVVSHAYIPQPWSYVDVC